MYRRIENQCHCCNIYHFQRPDLNNFVKRQQTTLPVRRRRDLHTQDKNPTVRNVDSETLGPHRKGHNFCPRDLQYVAKVNVTPNEEFKREIHSIKREAERKFIGALTKFHYRRIERNNDKLRRAKTDKSRSKRDTDRA